MNLFLTILTSSIGAAILNHFGSIYLRNTDFKNEYFKIVIKKRLEAYDLLEYLISILKVSSLDETDGKAYHLIFAYGEDEYIKSTKINTLANSNNIWLSTKADEKLAEILSVFHEINFSYNIQSKESLISAGKDYYFRIATLRTELENIVRADLIDLHKISDIRGKKTKDGYVQINIKKNKK